MNYLNTMIGAVGHDDGIVRANREASRPRKASGFAPPHPELVQLSPLQQVVTPPAIAVDNFNEFCQIHPSFEEFHAAPLFKPIRSLSILIFFQQTYESNRVVNPKNLKDSSGIDKVRMVSNDR